MGLKKLLLNAIRIDGGTQPRERINMEVVGDYAEGVKVGIEFPPVIVFHDGAEYWLADGFHRWHAHKQAGKASIEADVRNGTLLDAKLHAVGSNGDHGLRRSNEDKRRAVQMVLDEPAWAGWSDRKIADACGVSAPFVSAIRRPEVAAKQQENRVATAERKAAGCNPITPPQDSRVLPHAVEKTIAPPAAAPQRGQTLPPPADAAPSDDEIAASQKAIDDELAELRAIALADDKLGAALAAVKRLTAQNRVLTERNNGLMNEKAELVKRIKSLQRKLEAQGAVA